MSIASETRKIGIVTIIQYLAFCFYLLVIPTLFGPEHYGVLVTVTTSTVLFSLISDLGINVAIYRYVPQHAALGQDEKIRGLIRRCNMVRFLSIIPFILLWIVFFIPLGLDVVIVASGAAVFCGMAFVGYLYSIAYGRGKSGWYTSKDAFRAILRIFFLVVGFTTFGLGGAILGLVFVEGILIVIGLGLVWGDLFGKTEDVPFSSYLSRASQFWVYKVLLTVYHALSIYITQFFMASYTQVGYYSFGMDFGRFTAVFLSSIGIAALPVIIELFTDGEKQRVIVLVERATKYLAVIAPVVILWEIFFVPIIIISIIPSYLPSVIIAQISLLWVFPASVSAVFSGVVLAKEKPIIVIRARVLSLVFFLILAIITGPAMGILGIAWSYTCGQVVEAISTTWGAIRTFALKVPKRAILVAPTLTFFLWIGIALLSPPISIPIATIFIPFTSVCIIIWVPLSFFSLVIASIVYLILLIASGTLTRMEFKEILYAIIPLDREKS